VLYRGIRLPAPQPKPGTPLPTQCGVWIELQAAVEQTDSDIGVFAKVTECEAGATEDLGIITRDLKCPPRELDALPASGFWIIGPAVDVKILLSRGRLRQSRAVLRIALDGLLQ